jgi:hypothetical protein
MVIGVCPEALTDPHDLMKAAPAFDGPHSADSQLFLTAFSDARR